MATILRSLIDAVGVTDAPNHKTVSPTGSESAGLTDYIGEIRQPGPIVDAVGITDVLSVVKGPTLVNPVGVTDSGGTYIRGYTGVDNVGITDVVTVTTTSAQTHTRTIIDGLTIHDLDLPQQQSWLAAPDDTISITDTIVSSVQQGSTPGSWTASLVDSMDNVDILAVLRGMVLADDAVGITDSVTVVQTSGTFYSPTIIDDVGLTDKDGLGNDNVQPSKVQVPSLSDILTLTDTLLVELASSVIIFRGPTVSEGPAGGDELFSYYTLLRGITVVQDQDGSWRQVRYPTSEELAAAQRVYRGGYTYSITQADADALTLAGFGAYLTTTPPVFSH